MPLLSSIPGLLLIIVGFGVLIFVHELGHFIAAKWAGIRTEAFAVGMGPVMVSWRKGIGVRFGSTLPDYEKRVREHLAEENAGANRMDTSGAGGGLTREHAFRIGDQIGLGETEYSLRWLPIGGFVKMLGQEDANPNAVSDDPRSYNRCPIGKRMIVVSAGVIMNVILALVLFVWAFLVGVRFEAPVIGNVAENMPAATATALNAEALGIREPGLQPGDQVRTVNGKRIDTFGDVQVETAMARPNELLTLTVERAGYSELLRFQMTPEKSNVTSLLGIGVEPGRSVTMLNENREVVLEALRRVGLAQQGVEPGMRMVTVNGEPITTFQQLDRQAERSLGKPLETRWQRIDKSGEPTGEVIDASVAVIPEYQILRYPNALSKGGTDFEQGLFGLLPLTKIVGIEKSSKNFGILKEGDIVLSFDSIPSPRVAEFREAIAKRPGKTVPMTVLRDDEAIELQVEVNRKGMLNVGVGWAFDEPLLARTLDRVRIPGVADDDAIRRTAAAPLALVPGTRITAVNETAINDWPDLRAALRAQTADAFAAQSDAVLNLHIQLPTPGHETAHIPLALTADDVQSLHQLSWRVELSDAFFEPVYTELSADGSPTKAVAMGFERTHALIMMTYLTIDRLIRGSVGVEQLRGPVGIIDLGVKIFPKGFMYFIFFLGMISVNLAVINFLPLPIVDGGLFLFLLYEKFRGRPPSLQFQNAATIAGLFLIGTVFLVTFYNDIARLLS